LAAAVSGEGVQVEGMSQEVELRVSEQKRELAAGTATVAAARQKDNRTQTDTGKAGNVDESMIAFASSAGTRFPCNSSGEIDLERLSGFALVEGVGSTPGSAGQMSQLQCLIQKHPHACGYHGLFNLSIAMAAISGQLLEEPGEMPPTILPPPPPPSVPLFPSLSLYFPIFPCLSLSLPLSLPPILCLSLSLSLSLSVSL
jgi:hypothetical protein